MKYRTVYYKEITVYTVVYQRWNPPLPMGGVGSYQQWSQYNLTRSAKDRLVRRLNENAKKPNGDRGPYVVEARKDWKQIGEDVSPKKPKGL